MSGCKESGHTIQNKVEILSLTVEENQSNSYRAGDPVYIFTTFQWKELQHQDQNVQLYYYLFDHNRQEKNETDIVAYHLGTVNVHFSGTSMVSRQDKFYIPDSIKHSGAYDIMVFDDLMQKLNKNTTMEPSSGETSQIKNTININKSEADLRIRKIQIEENDVSVETNDSINGNREAQIHGSITLHTVQANKLAIIKVQILIDNNWKDLLLWDSEALQYKKENQILLNEKEIDYYFPLLIKFPKDAISALQQEHQTSNESSEKHWIRLRIEEKNQDGESYTIEEREGETSLSKELAIHLYTTSSPKLKNIVGISADFNSGSNLMIGKKKYFASGLKLKGHAGFDLFPIPAFNVSADIDLPLYIGGAYNDFLEYQIRYSKNLTAVEESISLNNGGETKIYMLENLVYKENNFGRELNWEKEDSPKFDQKFATGDFMVGPIPITVTFGARGYFYYYFMIRFSDHLLGRTNIHPYLAAYLRGGVGIPDASVGVETDLVILEDRFSTSANINPTVIQGKVVNNKIELDIIGVDIALNAHNNVEIISGKVGLYCDYLEPKWCKKGVFTYPCGKKEGESYLWFYHYPHALYHFNDTLLDFNRSYMMKK